jgi:hypothetical protein
MAHKSDLQGILSKTGNQNPGGEVLDSGTQSSVVLLFGKALRASGRHLAFSGMLTGMWYTTGENAMASE